MSDYSDSDVCVKSRHSEVTACNRGTVDCSLEHHKQKYSNLFTQLYWLRRFGATQRFHGHTLRRPETVFHHSASVAQLLIQAVADPSVALLKAAIQHDLEEGVTGDVPAPTKWALGASGFGVLEGQIRDYFGIKHPELSILELRLLKAADMLDAVLTCLYERAAGNREVDWVFDNYARHIAGMPDYWKGSEQFAVLQSLWFRIVADYRRLQLGKEPTNMAFAESQNFWTRFDIKVCKTCYDQKTIAVSCECYEMHGGHQPGCPYHGANVPVGGFEQPCPDCAK